MHDLVVVIMLVDVAAVSNAPSWSTAAYFEGVESKFDSVCDRSHILFIEHARDSFENSMPYNGYVSIVSDA